MRTPTRHVNFLCLQSQYEQILAIADRYDMTVTDVITFLFDIALQQEKDFRPILKIANHFAKKEGEDTNGIIETN